MDRKDIFMSGFKSKIGYSFTYKDLAEFEAIIDFYEQQAKKQKEVIDKITEYITKEKNNYLHHVQKAIGKCIDDKGNINSNTAGAINKRSSKYL